MLTGYLRQRRRTLLAFFLFGGIFAAAFALYQLPLRAVAYPFVLCAAAGAVLLTLDYRRVLRQHRRLELLRQLPEELADALPPADTVKEADYRSLVTLLAESRRAIRTQEEQRYSDMVDYYTMWAHQIKTPIASMRLTLQNEDSGLARSLSGDLMRVEQYVEILKKPYAIAVNPVNGDIYITDAGNYVTPGWLYCLKPDGTQRWRQRTGDIPAHFAFYATIEKKLNK